MDIEHWITRVTDSAAPMVVDIGSKVLGALALWIVGGLIIRIVKGLVRRSVERRKLDPTLVRYTVSLLNIVLQILLAVAILGVFGVQTTTFAAVLAAAGVAIGMAWSGLLANFAAGVFLIVLRPFKAGDMITVCGITGVVQEIGLFVTVIDTPDNIRTIIGNNKIFSDTIQNYTANTFRRVELTAQLAHSVNPQDAIVRLRARLAQIPNVATNPAPDVEIVTFTMAGPVLAVRPYTHNDHYWQVYFATNQAIAEEFGKAGYAVPEHHYYVRKQA